MLIEVGVYSRRIIDGRKADDPGEDWSSVRVHLTVCPCRTVLATIDRFPMRRVDRAVDGGNSRTSVRDRLNVVTAFSP